MRTGASIGVAPLGTDFDVALRAADRAMYAVKQDGRAAGSVGAGAT